MDITNDIAIILDRDLQKVEQELCLYHSDDAIWKTTGAIKNCTGNLVLHIIGNLNAYIGAELGDTGYERKRDREFADKGIPREQMLDSLRKTREMIKIVLKDFSAEKLDAMFPIKVFAEPTSIRFFLVHLTTHLNYHLGQINYHRRLLDPTS